jgi:hypothetical protein
MEVFMRKMIFLAIAGFVWRKVQSRFFTGHAGRTVRRNRF